MKFKKPIAYALATALATATVAAAQQPAQAMGFLLPTLISIAPWAIDKAIQLDSQTSGSSGGLTYRHSQAASYQYFQTGDGTRLNCDVSNPGRDGNGWTAYYCTTQFKQSGWFAQSPQQELQPPQQQSVAQQDMQCRFDLGQSNGTQIVFPCLVDGQIKWYTQG